MCKQKIIVPNPSRTYIDGLHKMFLRVPCGKCKECIKSNQDDWFIRSLFEYKKIRSVGGDCWFLTLTYNNENLPFYEDKELGFKCMCFDYHHIKRFRDKLRIYLKRKGFPSNQLKYIITPEFGDTYGRSHYHALVFTPFHLSPAEFIPLVKKAWIYGFVRRSKNHGWYVDSIKGVQYCCKYCCKPQFWLDKYNIPAYVQRLKDLDKDCPSDIYKERLKFFKRFSPHHYQSTFFGISGLDYYRLPSGEFDMDKLIDSDISLFKLGFNTLKRDLFRMPRYFYKKIFTNVLDGVSYKNELYTKTLSTRFTFSIDNKLLYYQPYFGSINDMFLHLAPLNRFSKDDLLRIKKDVFSLFKDKLDDLATFDLVYRDLPSSLSPDLSQWKFSGNNEPELKRSLLDSAFDFFFNQETSYSVPTPKKESLKVTCPELFDKRRYLYNDLPCFVGWSDILDFIDSCERSLGELSTKSFVRDEIINSSRYKGDLYV